MYNIFLIISIPPFKEYQIIEIVYDFVGCGKTLFFWMDLKGKLIPSLMQHEVKDYFMAPSGYKHIIN